MKSCSVVLFKVVGAKDHNILSTCFSAYKCESIHQQVRNLRKHAESDEQDFWLHPRFFALERLGIMSMSGGARVLAMSGYVWVNVLPHDGKTGLPRLGQ